MTTTDPRHAAWRVAFVALGEESVRMMDSGSQLVPDDRLRFSRVWLKEQEDVRGIAASALRDSREEETLSIARRSAATAEEALSTAKSANLIASEQLLAARRNARYAMYAAAIAAAAAIVSAKEEIWSLIAKLL